MIIRYLCSADWHVHNWEQYSSKDKNGISDRLLKFKQLAIDFNNLSKRLDCDFRIIAGDFTQSSLIPPYVINIEREVLTILNEQPTIMCTGQHDLSSKSTGSSEVHSLLFTTSSRLENIEYHAEVLSVINYKGLKIGIRPWNKEEFSEDSDEYQKLKSENLDLFIGHDGISTATNNLGHQFFGGYNPNTLMSIAPVSVCGDIHKHHLFEKEGRIALIPGCPIQSTYKDYSDCGFWLVEYDTSTKTAKTQFFNIHELHPDFYHQFIYVESEDEIPEEKNPLVHYRIRSSIKIKKDEEGKEVPVKTIEYNLPDLVHKVSQDNKPDEVDSAVLEESINELFDKVKFVDAASIKRSKITKVSIRNFCSIKEFDLDFDAFDRDLVFIGNTGSGKSSVVEAIYWAITNKTTKGLSVSSIRNWNASPDESAVVSLYMTIDDSNYIIKRVRSVKGGSVEILKEINGEYCAFEANTMRETDNSILDLLNLKEWEVFLLSYYAAGGVDMYNDLGKSTKTELLNKIVSSDEVNTLREVSGYDLKEMQTEFDRCQTAYETMKSAYNKNDSDITSMKSLMDSQKEQIEKKAMLEQKLSVMIPKYDSSELTLNKLDQEILETMNKLSEVTSEYKVLLSKKETQDRLKNKLKEVTNQLEEFRNSETKICPTCGSKLADDSISKVISKYNTELAELNSSLDFSVDYVQEEKRCLDRISELNSLIKIKQDEKILENNFQSEFKALKAKIEGIKIDDRTSVINYLIETNIKLKSEIDEVILKGKKLKVKCDCYEYLNKKVFKRDGYLTRKLNSLALEIIQNELDSMCAEYTFKGKIDENFNLNISFQGRRDCNYTECSTGQKLVSNVIMSCVLQNVFSRLYGLPEGILGLSVWDDIFSTIDSEYTGMVKDMLDKTVTRKYIVLTHNSNMSELFANKILVSLPDGDGGSSCYDFSFDPLPNK